MAQLLEREGWVICRTRGSLHPHESRGALPMIADPLLWLLQANDSAYPSGAYAHSFGLEEIVESGVVRNATRSGGFHRKTNHPRPAHL